MAALARLRTRVRDGSVQVSAAGIVVDPTDAGKPLRLLLEEVGEPPTGAEGGDG